MNTHSLWYNQLLTIYPNHPHLHHASIHQWLGCRKVRLLTILSVHYEDRTERWFLRRVANGLVTTYPKNMVGFGYALLIMRANSRLWSSRSRGSSSAENLSQSAPLLPEWMYLTLSIVRDHDEYFGSVDIQPSFDCWRKLTSGGWK